MSNPISVAVVSVIAGIGIPILALFAFLGWECWKTEHRPGYVSRLLTQGED